jgi:hypothetical protein
VASAAFSMANSWIRLDDRIGDLLDVDGAEEIEMRDFRLLVATARVKRIPVGA